MLGITFLQHLVRLRQSVIVPRFCQPKNNYADRINDSNGILEPTYKAKSNKLPQRS